LNQLQEITLYFSNSITFGSLPKHPIAPLWEMPANNQTGKKEQNTAVGQRMPPKSKLRRNPSAVAEESAHG